MPSNEFLKGYIRGLQDAREMVEDISHAKVHSNFAIAIAKMEQTEILRHQYKGANDA